jgi:hypothetical protein
LGICTAIPTKRGKRSGKSKCHAVMNERGAVQKIKSIVTNRSNQQSNISCGVNPPNLTCLSPVNRKTSLTNICILNARSVKNKTTTLKDYMIDNKIDIFGITETWLRPGEADNMTLGDLTPPGYSTYHVPRQNRRGGRGCTCDEGDFYTKESRAKTVQFI